MTDMAKTIAALREMILNDPYLGKPYRSALRDAADALEAAEKVIEPFVALCDEIEQCATSTTDDVASDPRNWVKACQWDDLIAVRNWRDKYGKRT